MPSSAVQRCNTPRKFENHAERRCKIVAAAAVENPVEEEPAALTSMSVQDMKAALLDSLFGLERGLKARGETKAELNELIGQLESSNPTPSPTEADEKLSGSWKLMYTTSPSTLALLGLSRLPLVKVGDITQMIDGPGMTVENKIQISVPFSRTSFSTSAAFEVSSPKRLRLQIKSGNIATPELLEDIDLPDSVSLMGQTIDLSPLKQALQPFNSTVKDAVAQLGNLLSQQPDLKIPIQEDRAPVTWLLTTYLDEDTRISRGNGGTVYVFVKDVSFEDTTEETQSTAEADTLDSAPEPVEEAVDEVEAVEEEKTPAEETTETVVDEPKATVVTDVEVVE